MADVEFIKSFLTMYQDFPKKVSQNVVTLSAINDRDFNCLGRRLL